MTNKTDRVAASKEKAKADCEAEEKLRDEEAPLSLEALRAWGYV
jgi:hypothetical protein